MITLNKLEDIADELAIFLQAFFLAGLLGILLQSPDSPKRHIRLFHLSDIHGDRFAFHKLIVALYGGLHHEFEVVVLIYGEGQAWQCDECITGTALEPRISCQDIAVVILLTAMELVSRIDKAVEEVVARRTLIYLLVEETLQCTGLDFRCGGSEDNALALLDILGSSAVPVIHSSHCQA